MTKPRTVVLIPYDKFEGSLGTTTFDEMYGAGAYATAQEIINNLGPVTRRDEWWETDGPYEIIGRILARKTQES